jgi:hypothetical protein
MPAMLRARLCVASDLGNLASLLASCHGSSPNRANKETTLRAMPFASIPTVAKRKSFSLERRKAKTSVLVMLRFPKGSEFRSQTTGDTQRLCKDQGR